jgi:hypothetical protein
MCTTDVTDGDLQPEEETGVRRRGISCFNALRTGRGKFDDWDPMGSIHKRIKDILATPEVQ